MIGRTTDRGRQTARPQPWYAIVGRYLTYPLSVPLALFAVLAIVETVLRLVNPVPVSPWDAAAIVEADRFALGLPLYEHWMTGHSSWTYGPGMLWIGGFLFRFFGPSALILKFVSAGCVAVTIALCFITVRRSLPIFWRIIALLSFIAVDGRVAYFGVIRPDSIAYALAFSSLIVFYRRGRGYVIISSVLLAAAVLTKQTAIMFAIVPPIATLIERQVSLWRRTLLALMPGVASISALILLFLCFPSAWAYLVGEARFYPVLPRELLKNSVLFISGASVFWFAIGMALARNINYDDESRSRLLWSGVTLGVSTLGCLVAMSKVGGWINSLAPLYFSMLVFSWLAAAPWLAVSKGKGFSFVSSLGFLLAATFSLTPIWPSYDPVRLVRSTAVADYRSVIAQTRALPGAVLSPFDPSITLLARGQHDPSVVLTNDTLGWPRPLPADLLDRAYHSPYIVQQLGTAASEVLDLPARKYQIVWRNNNYAIWRELRDPREARLPTMR